MQHRRTSISKTIESYSALVQAESFCISNICIKCNPEEQGAANVPSNTLERMGHAIKEFSVPALSKAIPLNYYSCFIYLYIMDAFFLYHMQLTSKSVTFPTANQCLPLWKFSILLQELSRALFHAFTHLHQLQITQKRSKMSSVAVMRRER